MRGEMLGTGFIGAGTVGTALAVLLDSKGYRVTGVSDIIPAAAKNLADTLKTCRALDSNQDVADTAELVFITTPDTVIPTVASQLKWHKGQSIVHCSGADSTDILEPARQAGAGVGSFHPLQTFAGVREAVENIPGSTFAIESSGALADILKQMAADLGGNSIELKAGDKVAYHAAAVLACNYLVTLTKMSTDLWQTFDVPPGQAVTALLPLMRGTLHNIETIGLPRCLTGPIARGDAVTVSKHLKALKQKSPSLLTTYRELGLQTIPVAIAKGKITENQAHELEDTLKQT